MNQEEESIDHGIPIKSFHHSSFALPFVSGSNKKGGGKHQISSHLSAYIMFRVPSKATYFPGNRQPRILNGVLKRNDFAAGRQNAERTSASVPTTNVPTHIYIYIHVRMPTYTYTTERERAMTRVEKDGRGPRGKSFTVKIPRVFQDDRLNAVLNEPRVFLVLVQLARMTLLKLMPHERARPYTKLVRLLPVEKFIDRVHTEIDRQRERTSKLLPVFPPSAHPSSAPVYFTQNKS